MFYVIDLTQTNTPTFNLNRLDSVLDHKKLLITLILRWFDDFFFTLLGCSEKSLKSNPCGEFYDHFPSSEVKWLIKQTTFHRWRSHCYFHVKQRTCGCTKNVIALEIPGQFANDKLMIFKNKNNFSYCKSNSAIARTSMDHQSYFVLKINTFVR